MSSGKDNQQDYKQIISKLSQQEKKELLLTLTETLKEGKELVAEITPYTKESEKELSDKEKHRIIMRQLDIMLNKLEKTIAEIEELKKQKAPLLEVTQ